MGRIPWILMIALIHSWGMSDAAWNSTLGLTDDQARELMGEESSHHFTHRLASPREYRRRIAMPTEDQLPAAQLDLPALVERSESAILQRRPRSRPGYSGDVINGKSIYVLKHNGGVPTYGFGEPYFFDYFREFPVPKAQWDNILNSHRLPKRYRFSGSLNLLDLLDDA